MRKLTVGVNGVDLSPRAVGDRKAPLTLFPAWLCGIFRGLGGGGARPSPTGCMRWRFPALRPRRRPCW